VSGTGCDDWGSAESLGHPTLLWVEGPEAIAESHRLSALLSERGYPNRWLPLYRRPCPAGRRRSLPSLGSETQPRHLSYTEVPLLVLSDAEARLHSPLESPA
jgi:hypothetical protein